MNIWLINPYGPIPGEGWRDYRFTIIGETLAQHGHQVTWWTANFSHHFKRFRSKGWKDLAISPNFGIRLVPTSGYQRHISLGRVGFELSFTCRVLRRATRESPPECIIAVDPPQAVGTLAVTLARRYGARLILDVMDLWPELFVLGFPPVLRPLAPVVCRPLYMLRGRNWRQADAVTALCDTYLEVAKREAGNQRKPFVTIFNAIDVEVIRRRSARSERMIQLLMAEAGRKASNEVWAVYAGTLGENYDINTLLQAAVYLEARRSRLKILIAGEGPMRERISTFIAARRLRNLVYLGKLDTDQLAGLYQACDIGLCIYGPESNVAMPDKAYDYMAAGLPIVNSLHGELERLLREKQMGIQYVAGDAESLVNALAELASDAGKRRMMAENGYTAAMMFDRRVQYAKFLDVLEQVMRQ